MVCTKRPLKQFIINLILLFTAKKYSIVYNRVFAFLIRVYLEKALDYEPGNPPPQKKNCGGWVHFFSYRCLVFPKKCPQRK